jgi:hypothetical protein
MPIFLKLTADWRAGCGKSASPVRREGRPCVVPTPIYRIFGALGDSCYARALALPECWLKRPQFYTELRNDLRAGYWLTLDLRSVRKSKDFRTQKCLAAY